MKIPSSEKGPQSFVDEHYHSEEHAAHKEFHTPREVHTNPELFRTDEQQTPKDQSPSDKRKREQERNTKLLAQYAAGIFTAVAAATVLLPTIPATPPPPAPSFSVEQTVGLHDYECVLTAENVDGIPLQALLTTADGELLQELPLPEDGRLAFTELSPETSYILSMQDDAGETLFTHTFTTDPFFTLIETEDAYVRQLILHEDISSFSDAYFLLLDSEGKEFRYFAYAVYPEDELPTDSSSDSAEEMPLPKYYLNTQGLYADEYLLQFTCYPPDVDGELVYQSSLSLGALTPLSYEGSIDGTSGDISLRYLSGDTGPYQDFYVELQQGEEYYYVNNEDLVFEEDDIRIPASVFAEWPTGTYTLYLVGSYSAGEYEYFEAQIWKSEITIE